MDSDPLSRRSSPSSNSDTNVTLEPMTTSISEVLTSLQRHPTPHDPTSDAEDRMRFRSLPNRNNRIPAQPQTGNGNRDFVNGNAKFGVVNNNAANRHFGGGPNFGNGHQAAVEDLYAKVSFYPTVFVEYTVFVRRLGLRPYLWSDESALTEGILEVSTSGNLAL